MGDDDRYDDRRHGDGHSRESRTDDRRRDDESEIITCNAEDAAFILGKGGQTKQKISRVCGATIELNERENTIELFGTDKQRQLAKDYIGYIMKQRTGSVSIDIDSERDDMTVVRVPEDCVAFVMGRGGQTLRMMEGEWGTLMFFAKGMESDGGSSEMLMIFGPLRSRRGAEMKVMSAIEHKSPGTFIRDGKLAMQSRIAGDFPPEGWDVDQIPLHGDEFSYALGSGGSTRRKLAAASGCILEYVGKMACLVGFKRDRHRCRDYLKWLLKQKHGPLSVEVAGREDVITVPIPSSCVGWVTGFKGEALRRVEQESGTFCFINAASERGEEETLLIFSYKEDCRRRGKDIVLQRISEHQRGGGGGGPRGGGGGYSGERYDDRRGGHDNRYDSRYDDRRRDDRYDDRRRDDRYDDRRRDDRYDNNRYDNNRYDNNRYGERGRDERRRDDRYDDRRR